MWRRYFPNARIVGVDIYPKAIQASRMTFERGDQSDPVLLQRLVRDHGPFDLVIDDGSHIGRHITASFSGLWDAVKPGGYYVIEDLQASYHHDWEGGPPGTPGTGAALIKDLVDSTLKREGDVFVPVIAAMHVYGGIAFLEKS
jgi:demethylmacrocin O-methyltransferase